MALGLYLTHPQVVQNPDVPVPRWGLNEKGRTRVETFAARDLLPAETHVISSLETKALETGAIIAEALGGSMQSFAAFDENDRSATGWVPNERFEQLADAFFGNPEQSTEGWERAIDAQERMFEALRYVLADHAPGRPLLLVGHGGVGTLLKCKLGGRKIARSEDQRVIGDPGGGNIFAFDPQKLTLVSDWIAMEMYPPN